MRVFITGGTGLIGSRLVRRLLERGDKPVVLTRSAAKAQAKFGSEVEIVAGDPMQIGPWMRSVAGCDAVINLVGEGIVSKRWTTAFKQLLVESRTIPTRNLVAALREQPATPSGQPQLLVNASAIGYYGPHADELLDENSRPASDFLGQLCSDWEKEAFAALAHGVRVCTVRVGIVLDREGGALGQMLPLFRWGLGGRLGSGKQWMSWIHWEDLVSLFLLPLDNPQATGPLNGTAPNPVTNLEFTKTLGRVVNRPTWLPAPAWGLRLLLGEAANVVMAGQRVLPRASEALGFTFRHPTLEAALRQLIREPDAQARVV